MSDDMSDDMMPAIDLTSVSETQNQNAAAESFNPILQDNPEGEALVTAFLPLTFEEATSALDDLSGVQHTENTLEANMTGLFVVDALADAIGEAISQAVTGLSRFASLDDGVRNDASNGVAEKKFHAFARGIYRRGSIDEDAQGASRVQSESLGAIFGAGLRLSEDVTAGVALGYSDSDNAIADRESESDLSSKFISVYGRYENGPYDVDAIIGYVDTDIETSRAVRIGTQTQTAVAEFDASGVIAHIETGYTTTLKDTQLRLSVGAGVSSTNRDEFTETGAGLANLVGTEQTDVLGDVELKARATRVYSLRGAKVTPYVGVGVQRLFGDVTPDATLSFQAGGPAFTVAGASLDRTRGLVEAGAKVKVGNNVDLFVQYDGAYASDSRENTVGFGVKVRF